MTDKEAADIAAEVPLDLAPLAIPARGNGKGNGNGHSNGHAPSSPIQSGNGSDSYRYGSDRDTDKVHAATVRMVNSFMGFITNGCGRQADQMTAGDFDRLTQIMKIMEATTAETKRGRLS